MLGHGQSLNPAAFKYNWQGAWSPNDIYDYRDVVKHRGRTYYCNTDALRKGNLQGYLYEPGKTGNAWTVHTVGQVNRGGWGPHKQYEVGDLVMYKGSWYLCKIAGYGIHPIYDNGSLTNKWTKVIASPQLSNPSKFIPMGPNENPLGWNKFRGAGNGFGIGWGSGGSEGTWLVDWDGLPKWYGRTLTHGVSYHKHLNIGTDEEFKQGWSRAFQMVDFLRNDKFPLTDSSIECVQILPGNDSSKFLLNNGEVYTQGYQTGYSHGTGVNNTTNYTPMRVGHDHVNNNWSDSITGTFRDAFIVKLAGGTHGDQASTLGSHAIALDSEGYIWVWGDTNRGILGIGDGASAALSVDRGIPVRLRKDMFGGNDVIDIYGCLYHPNAAYYTWYAITDNGLVYSWGANEFGQAGTGTSRNGVVRRPQPVFDSNKYGGIRRIAPHSGNHPFCVILTNDGTMHITGHTDYVNHTYTSRADGHYNVTFTDMRQFWYNSHRTGHRGERTDYAIDGFTGVQDLWVYNHGYHTAGNEGGGIFKDSDGYLREFGNGKIGVPRHRLMSGYDTSSSQWLSTAENYFPPMVDMTSLNGRVEWVLPWGGSYNGGDYGGIMAIDEEGRTKVNIGEGDNSARNAAGWGGNSFGTTTDAQIAMAMADRMMYVDESAIQYQGAVSTRGSWRANRTVHATGAVHAASAYTAWISISEDGTAGAFGNVDNVTHSFFENRTNIGTIAVAINSPTNGRQLFA